MLERRAADEVMRRIDGFVQTLAGLDQVNQQWTADTNSSFAVSPRDVDPATANAAIIELSRLRRSFEAQINDLIGLADSCARAEDELAADEADLGVFDAAIEAYINKSEALRDEIATLGDHCADMMDRIDMVSGQLQAAADQYTPIFGKGRAADLDTRNDATDAMAARVAAAQHLFDTLKGVVPSGDDATDDAWLLAAEQLIVMLEGIEADLQAELMPAAYAEMTDPADQDAAAASYRAVWDMLVSARIVLWQWEQDEAAEPVAVLEMAA